MENMSLKAAFRYLKFLDGLMNQACIYIGNRETQYEVKKLHLKSKHNPDAEDIEEVEEKSIDYNVDTLISFASSIIHEREKLMSAVNEAKKSCPIDIDANVEANKYRHRLYDCVSSMLRQKPKTKVKERGSDYKFNAEGNQQIYYYDIEATYIEAFDRERDRKLSMEIIQTADRVSDAIDSAMVSYDVDYEPKYDVNSSFDDVMSEFVSNHMVH